MVGGYRYGVGDPIDDVQFLGERKRQIENVMGGGGGQPMGGMKLTTYKVYITQHKFSNPVSVLGTLQWAIHSISFNWAG